MMTNYGLVIGINHYTPVEDGGLRELKGAIKDAIEFHKWLCSPTGGNLLSKNTHLITSNAEQLRPEYDEIDQKLNLIIKELQGQQGDRFYFYFAGHGLSVEKDPDQVALCLCKWSDDRRNYALSFEEYKKLIIVCRYFKETVFFLDCCRTEMLHIKPLHPTLTERDGTHLAETKPFVAYATQNKQESFEASNGVETRGVFTEVLLDGLNGSAVNADGNVDATSLNSYLTFAVPRMANAKGFTQEPRLAGHMFKPNELVFASIQNMQQQTVSCHITISARRNGLIDLYAEKAKLLKTIDTAVERTFTIALQAGPYALLERATGKSVMVNVVNSNPIQHVTF